MYEEEKAGWKRYVNTIIITVFIQYIILQISMKNIISL